MLRALVPFIAILPATAYSLISLACARRFFRAEGCSPSSYPSPVGRRAPTQPHPPGEAGQTPGAGVTILKPVKGMDAGSYDNFASFCRQDYSGPRQILFAAASAEDPVIPVIRRLIADFPGQDISLEINPAIHGPNYKVSNLINAFPTAKHDIIIVCDCDIRVPPDYLRSVMSHFDDPQVGLVSSLYRTSRVHSIPAALEATGITVEMIPNVLVALQLEGLSFALGASMAVRREALASIGGFEGLSDYLADDYHLGNKIHRAGWHISLDGCLVESIMKTESLTTVLSRQLRWAHTMRVSRPGGYLAYGTTLPFPAALFAVLTASSLPAGLTAVALLYTVRLAISTLFSRRLVGDGLFPLWLWIIPLRDILVFFCWALSFLGNRVEWRGSCFRLKSGGKIEEIV